MTDVRTNAPLARMFEYNAWANARTIDACRHLTDEQLDAPNTNALGSIRDTLLHVIHGQWSFLARLEGRAQDARALSPQWEGFDALTATSIEMSEALIGAAESLDADGDVVLAYMGKSHRYPKSFFLVHAIQHGVEHRIQIGMMLSRRGKGSPNLDGWEFAGATGLGEEIP